MSPLTFETFVELRCAIERGVSRATVLARAGVSEVQWNALQRRWLRAMAREAEAGGGDLCRRYVSEFRLMGDEASPAEIRVERIPAAAPAIPEARPPGAWPAVDPVAYAAQAGVSRSVQPLDARPTTTTMDPFSAPVRFPFTRGEGGSAPSRVAHEVAREATDMVGATGIVSAVVFEDAVPFARSSPGPNDPERSVDETAFFPVVSFDEDDDALPFENVPGNAAPAPVAAEVEREGAPMVGETSIVDAPSDEMLGLVESPPEPPVDATALGTSATDEVLGLLAPQQIMDTDTSAAPLTTSAGQVRHPVGLTVEQYASLRADLDRVGAAGRVDLLARYGVAGEDALVVLKRSWADRFRDDPAAYGRFRAAFDMYSRWLAGR